MTSKEKLVELLDNIIQPSEKTLGQIADYLLENGVIVPPDELYTIVDKGTHFEDIRPVRVDYLPLYAIKNPIKNGYYFTKEQARKALKERENNG